MADEIIYDDNGVPRAHVFQDSDGRWVAQADFSDQAGVSAHGNAVAPDKWSAVNRAIENAVENAVANKRRSSR